MKGRRGEGREGGIGPPEQRGAKQGLAEGLSSFVPSRPPSPPPPVLCCLARSTMPKQTKDKAPAAAAGKDAKKATPKEKKAKALKAQKATLKGTFDKKKRSIRTSVHFHLPKTRRTPRAPKYPRSSAPTKAFLTQVRSKFRFDQYYEFSAINFEFLRRWLSRSPPTVPIAAKFPEFAFYYF